MTENDVSTMDKAPKITSMINFPTKSKLSEINKSKDKENSIILGMFLGCIFRGSKKLTFFEIK